MQKATLLILSVFLGLGSFGQSLELSLREAKQMAIDSSYSTRNARYNTAKKKEEVREVLSIGLPQVNAQAELQNFLDLPVSLIPSEFTGGQPGEFDEVQFGTQYNLTAQVSASQLLFDGTYFIGLKASRVVVELSRNEEKKTEQEIKLSVAEAYHSVLLAEENARILEDNLENINQTLEETQKLYESGFTEEQDVDQLLLNKNQIQVNLDNTQRIYEISARSLNFIIGLPIETELKLTDNIESLVAMSNDREYLERDPNLETHPDLMLAKTNREIQELTVKGEKAAYYPSLSAFFNHQQVGQRNQFNFTDTEEPWFPTTIVGATLNIPIWSSFERQAKVRQAQIGLEQSEMQLRQTRENLALDMQRARSNYQNALKVYQNQKSSVELAQRILDKTTIKYKEGVVTSLELNVAQSQLLQEQSNAIQAAFELLSAKQELDRALNIF
ncbi:MAG: TolC family protein [Cryomorphaceae bacterium]|nr:TolC family protein [Flavobacteriales bacterium]